LGARVPFFISYVFTHVTRAVVPAAKLGAPYQQVSFTTSDGLTLHGWYVPSRNRAAVIAFPGRAGPQKHARMLVRHGYGVLLFDRAVRERATASRTRTVGRSTRTSPRRRRSSSVVPTSIEAGSAASDFPSAER
jgi:hypothetical protein